jgi:hypothetical protein
MLAAGRSSHERRPSTFWNSVTSSPTNSVREVSLGEHPSIDSAAEVTNSQKRNKLFDHFCMMEGCKLHPLRQMMLHPWRIDDGMT